MSSTCPKVLVLAASLLALPSVCLADRGSVPFKPGVKIFEPNQRAMIAWNGEEEILLLSTDLRASEPTKVLEVIPLPSEPKVKKGDVKVFERAVRLINTKLPRRDRDTRGNSKGKKAAPAGRVTLHERIGAHDISVTRVENGRRFVDWVGAYLRKAGAKNPTIPPILRQTINAYIQEGFTWFVFDVVELGTKTRTNDAIQYRFKSKCLYYPMKISRTERGNTSVRLLVLTPKLLSHFPGIPASQIQLAHQPVTITSRELASLNRDMDALLGHQPRMKLRIWRLQGDITSFDRDLLGYETKPPKSTPRPVMCARCRTMAFIRNIGVCGECGGRTGSGGYKMCSACAKQRGVCKACGKKIP